MRFEQRTHCGWRGHERRLAIGLLAPMALAIAGCEPLEQAVGPGPGICLKDLLPTNISIDLSPSFNGFLVGGAGPAPTNPDFLEFNHAFAIEWQFAYDGLHWPSPQGHSYTTIISILGNDEVIWEMIVDSVPVEIGDEGSDAVYVADGLPIGAYEICVQLDPDGNVPQCDDLGSVVNNTKTITIVVHGSTGPPQNPTPCEESQDPNCDDDEGPRGR